MTVTYSVGQGGIGTVPLPGDVLLVGDRPGFTSRADGSAGSSGALVTDPDADLDLIGLNKFEVDDDECDNPRIFTGIIANRVVSRNKPSHRVQDQRAWDTNLIDQNGYLNLRIIHDGNHGNRPAETDVERVAWLLDEVLNNGHVINGTGGFFGENGPTAAVLAAPRNLDAADYRGQYAMDVLSDIGPPGNRRFFVYWDPDLEDKCLFYGLNSDYLGTATIGISNVLSDLSSTVFEPKFDANLDRDPSAVYGAVYFKYRQGSASIYREDPAVLATYLDRGVAVTNDRVGSSATASTFVDRILDKAANERDDIACTITVPAEHVNHVIEGMRIEVRFSHLPGYETARYMHVLSRTVSDSATGFGYDIHLELSDYVGGFGNGGSGTGGPFVPDTGTCAGGIYPILASRHFNPLGSGTSDADGLIVYDSPGGAPGGGDFAPQPGHVGALGFASYGGPGGPDTTGDCTLSKMAFIVIGPGTLEIDTVGSSTLGVGWNLFHWDASQAPGSEVITDASGSVACGATITVVVPADVAENCVHIIQLQDGTQPGGGCGGPWGYSGADWTSASVGNSPAPGQQVTESATGDGITTSFGTNYGYYPNSLHVHVDGVAVVPTQDDPVAGTFTLPSAPASGSQVLITYQAASGTDTGAGNDPDPPSVAPPSTGAPTTADYLVGTAQGGLSAEIVVGTSPGGELGGTWASPTIDATHSGSSHASIQTAAEATAATALSGHTGDATDAHDASAISFVPAGTIAATDVQAAIEEVAAEAGVLDPDDVRDAGRWEIAMTPGITNPPEPVWTPDGTDYVYGWVT